MPNKDKGLFLEVLKKKLLKEKKELEKLNCLTSEYVRAEEKVLILERTIRNLISDLYEGNQCSFF